MVRWSPKPASDGDRRPIVAAIESFAPSQFGRMVGSSHLFLGAPERALPLLSRTADELADRPKTRSLVLGNVALGHLRQREIDAACDRLHEAIDLIEQNRARCTASLRR